VAVVVVLSPLAANDRGQLPVLETLVRAYPDVHFGRIDMLENPEVVSRFQVTASPVCLIFKDGQLVRQLSGMQSEKALRGVLDGLAG
jgi:thioredoxin-like negative regulator of GroEL